MVSSSAQLGLGPFLQDLERLLEELSDAELRQTLLDHAARLPPVERAEFLVIFQRHPGGHHTDPELRKDVESFLADIAAGKYVDKWGYDPEYRDDRAFGDESWMIEMAALFGRADAAFLAGEVVLARDVYRTLLEALLDDFGDESGFPGAGLPETLISTDVVEAKQRCLRCIWEAEPVPTRVAALLEAAEALTFIGSETTLAVLDAARRDPLPDLDVMLPDLVTALRGADLTSLEFGDEARTMLAEASERLHGTDGLADLAREPGPRQAEAYCDWVDALARERRPSDAEQAVREALDRLGPEGRYRAALAERLAVFATLREDGDGVLDARVQAWRADPSLARLLRLVDVASALGRRTEVLAAEDGRTCEYLLAGRPALAAGVLLLAGRVDAARAVAATADPGSWNGWYHPGPVVVAALLIGASGAASHPHWDDLLLRELLDKVDSIDRVTESDADLGSFADALPVPEEVASRFRGLPRDELLFSVQLVTALAEHPAGPEQRAEWLEDARVHVDECVDAVVSGQRRGAYQQAAHLVAACAEADVITDGALVAQRYLDGVYTRYPRHVAFRRQLRSVLGRSPLLR